MAGVDLLGGLSGCLAPSENVAEQLFSYNPGSQKKQADHVRTGELGSAS